MLKFAHSEKHENFFKKSSSRFGRLLSKCTKQEVCASQKVQTLKWPSNVKKNYCTPFFENLLFVSVLEMPRKNCPTTECTPFFEKGDKSKN